MNLPQPTDKQQPWKPDPTVRYCRHHLECREHEYCQKMGRGTGLGVCRPLATNMHVTNTSPQDLGEHLTGYAELLQQPEAPVSVLLQRADAEALLGTLPHAPEDSGNFWVHYVRDAPRAAKVPIHDPTRGKNLIGKMFQCLSWRTEAWQPDTPGAQRVDPTQVSPDRGRGPLLRARRRGELRDPPARHQERER